MGEGLPGKGAERRFWGNSSVLSLHVCICQNSSNDTLRSAAFQKENSTKNSYQVKLGTMKGLEVR